MKGSVTIKILNYLKNLFKQDNFININIGDIIWAKRYNNDKEKLRIKEGHQEGPYLVIYKKKNKLYCLPCTSQRNDIKWEQLYYNLGELAYGLEKDTFVRLNCIEIINPERYIRYLKSIDETELNFIMKRIYILKLKMDNISVKKNKEDKQNKEIKDKFIRFILSVGDIIYYDKNLYYINNVEDEYYQCDLVYLSKKSKKPININGQHYSFNFESNKKIDKRKFIELVDTCSKSKVESIAVLKENYFKLKRTKNIIKRGNMIRAKNGEEYYIYGEFENKWLVYKVYHTKEKINYVQVFINKGKDKLCSSVY